MIQLILARITTFITTIIALAGGMHGMSLPHAPLSIGTSTAAMETSSTAPVSTTSFFGIPLGTSSTPAPSASTYPTGSAWMTTLPLGDGKYVTSGAKQGYIYLCHVQTDGQGAKVVGSWIHGDTWDPAEKIAVQGAVSWPTAAYSMGISGANRVITTNDLPTDHTTGIFPVQSTDPAYQIDPNGNSITAQHLSFSLPVAPTALATPECIYGQVGIMTDGVWLFDGFDAENRDALAHELQDSYNGHPNQDGYHYHGFINELKGLSISSVVGYAFDGYPITGGQLPSGNYLHTADLDACHGITSAIMLDGSLVSTYHYVLTQDFPYSVSCFHGHSTFAPTPQSGSSQQQQGGQQQAGGNPPAPPQAAIDACSGKLTDSSCSVGATVTGTCATIGTSFACKPN